MTANRGRRSFWTWGHQVDEPSQDERLTAAKAAYKIHGIEVEPPPIPNIDDLNLRASRVKIPAELHELVLTDKTERVTHTYGGHTLEFLRAIRGDFAHPPDAVAYPANESELEQVIQWCDSQAIDVIPYGGGTSVVGGVNPQETSEKVVSIDLERMNKVLEIDETSRAGRFQAGILGPDLEAHLKPLGLTLRHYPQSFPWSTVGGWVATRSGGHYATNHTHIDDFTESIRTLTPKGWLESRRLPGSGAGPSPDRLMLGSEGALGVITDVWLRLQKRPVYRATAGILFESWYQGTDAVRHIAQAKLWPANLRILDPTEARLNAGVQQEKALLIVGFESADIAQGTNIRDAISIARECGGDINDEDVLIDDGTGQATGHGGAVGNWRNAFINVNAGAQLGLGILSDTFETATTWDNWHHFDEHVRTKVGRVVNEVLGKGSSLACRFTHVYPDGPAPYYSFRGSVAMGGEQEAWDAIKAAANDAVVDAGGTITHHHAVGKMHRPAWERQRPELFGSMLANAKRAVDPNGIMNPGTLLS